MFEHKSKKLFKDEARKLSTVQEIMLRSTDHRASGGGKEV